MSDRYYNVLGISKSATDEEIRAAYKRQALKWHPDKNLNNKEEAEKKFKELAEAYEVLKDPETRAMYDKYGEDGLKTGGGTTQEGGDVSGFPSGCKPYTHRDPFKVYEDFFSGG